MPEKLETKQKNPTTDWENGNHSMGEILGRSYRFICNYNGSSTLPYYTKIYKYKRPRNQVVLNNRLQMQT